MKFFTSGDVIFETCLPAAGRARIAEFAAGTEDPNPIHVDKEFAKSAGFPDVLQQGPMTTAQFARMLDAHAGFGRTRLLDIFFTAPVFPDDTLTLKAEVTEVGDIVRCALSAHKADGTLAAKGTAEIAS